MELFTWKSEHSVGILKIDEQHKKLMGIINQLHAAVIGRQPGEDMQVIFSGLIDYTVHYFSTEEELMAKYGFPGFDEHRKEHDAFRKKVIQFMDAFLEAKQDVAMDMVLYLVSWLRTHVFLTDKEYSAFLNDHGVI